MGTGDAVTRPAEIPDDVVSRAADAFRDNLEYDAFGEVGDDQRFDAMRVALVAARTYLMPTREQIAEAMHDHWSETHRWRQGCRQDVCIEIFLDRADAVLALLNGSDS